MKNPWPVLDEELKENEVATKPKGGHDAKADTVVAIPQQPFIPTLEEMSSNAVKLTKAGVTVGRNCTVKSDKITVVYTIVRIDESAVVLEMGSPDAATQSSVITTEFMATCALTSKKRQTRVACRVKQSIVDEDVAKHVGGLALAHVMNDTRARCSTDGVIVYQDPSVVIANADFGVGKLMLVPMVSHVHTMAIDKFDPSPTALKLIEIGGICGVVKKQLTDEMSSPFWFVTPDPAAPTVCNMQIAEVRVAITVNKAKYDVGVPVLTNTEQIAKGTALRTACKELE